MGGVFRDAAHAANSPANLMALCRPCHDWADANAQEARRRGWLVPHWRDAPVTPVQMYPIYGFGWWYLLQDLSYRMAPDEEVARHLALVAQEFV